MKGILIRWLLVLGVVGCYVRAVDSVDSAPAILREALVDEAQHDVALATAIDSAASPIVDAYGNKISKRHIGKPTKYPKISYENEAASEEPGKIMLGRDYYYAIIDKAMERRWVVPVTFYCGFANKALSPCCSTNSLSNLILGSSSFRLQDIFLLSKLSYENKIKSGQTNFTPNVPLDRPNDSEGLQFGNYRSDQYLASIANVSIDVNGMEQREFGCKMSGMHRFFMSESHKVSGIIGATLPIKSIAHSLDLTLDGEGFLYRSVYTDAGGTVRQNSLTVFFNDFVDIEDFFNRAVLEPKGIVYTRNQQTTGIGDVAFFGLVDFTGVWKHADGLQAGATVIVPTARKSKGNIIWEPVLGNDGGYQFDLFVNAIFNSPSAVFNPTVRLVGEFSKKFTGLRRIPQATSVTNVNDTSPSTQLEDIPGLLPPVLLTTWGKYFVQSFNAYGSSVAAFADSAVHATIKPGSKLLFGVGDYIYNAFNLGLRLGIFYDYMCKGRDKVCGVDSCDGAGPFNTDLLTRCTKSNSHTLGINLTYKFKSLVELNLGTENVIAGKNVPRYHDIFASIIFVF